jgi:hypothetical protein
MPGFLGGALATFDTHFCAALTRAFVGEDIADGLGIARTPWQYPPHHLYPIPGSSK